MSTPVRVLQVIHRIGDGGADHVLTRVVNHSDARRFQHTILALGAGPGYEPLRSDVRFRQVPPHGASVLGAMRALGPDAAARFDIVHGWVPHASIIGASLAAAFGVRLVLRQPTNMEQELRWEADQTAAYWRQLKSAYEVADAVVVPSPALVESTRRVCGVEEPVVIPNSIDVDASPAWQRPRAGHPFTMGFVGRLCPQKNPLGLVEALGLIKASFDWRLKVYGDGNLQPAMAGRLAALGISERVSFVGFDRGWLDPASGLDAFVLPTRYEGMSNAILEAAAAGMPIVTTAIPENMAILAHDVDVLLVAPDSPEALAAGIREMAADPERAAVLGARARDNMRRFSLGAMVAAHEALYTRLVQRSDATRAA